MTQLKTITVPAGLGDFTWMAMKLLNTGEKFHVNLPDGQPQRGHQMKDLLPNLIQTISYKPNLSYKVINNNNIQKQRKTWKRIIESGEKKFFLSANEHLEKGIRIEEWLPDLPATFKIDYDTPWEHKDLAWKMVVNHGVCIGIYTSAYSNARNWNGWMAKEWINFIGRIHQVRSDATFFIIGAEYDTGTPGEIMEWMDENLVNYVNTIGQPLTVVVELLKLMDLFCGFPSGLSILNATLGKRGIMFYPPKLERMINAWADPKMIANGDYKGCLFCEPEKIFDWLRNDYKFFDKI